MKQYRSIQSPHNRLRHRGIRLCLYLIFDRALSGNEINSLTSGEETLQQESLVRFDFSKYGKKSQSPNGIKITTPDLQCAIKKGAVSLSEASSPFELIVLY